MYILICIYTLMLIIFTYTLHIYTVYPYVATNHDANPVHDRGPAIQAARLLSPRRSIPAHPAYPVSLLPCGRPGEHVSYL